MAMTLKEYLISLGTKCGDYRLNLYVNGNPSLFCTVNDALKLFQNGDKRGNLLLEENPVMIRKSCVTGCSSKFSVYIQCYNRILNN